MKIILDNRYKLCAIIFCGPFVIIICKLFDVRTLHRRLGLVVVANPFFFFGLRSGKKSLCCKDAHFASDRTEWYDNHPVKHISLQLLFWTLSDSLVKAIAIFTDNNFTMMMTYILMIHVYLLRFCYWSTHSVLLCSEEQHDQNGLPPLSKEMVE